MNIVFFETKSWERRLLRRGLKNHRLLFFNEALSEKNVGSVHDFDIVSVFIYSKITEKLLKRLPKLKLITTRSTGYDHIDLKAAKRLGIVVCNVPYYGENTVAEHTFALILSLSRNVHRSYLRGLRNDFSIDGLKGFDLKGKTIGVIGCGHIGLHVIRIAKGFGMKVLAHDPYPNKLAAELLGFEYVGLNELLKLSDIVTLHVPYNKHTHHLIGKAAFKKMKRGAILINTARGAIVDTEALIEALDSGILAGAGLDVLEGEQLIKEEKQLLYERKNVEVLAQLVKDHILLSKDNVVFTPHMAFYSQEALERILDTTVQNIEGFIEKKPINVV